MIRNVKRNFVCVLRKIDADAVNIIPDPGRMSFAIIFSYVITNYLSSIKEDIYIRPFTQTRRNLSPFTKDFRV